MFERQYYVYIVTNRTRGTLYVGVTSDLVRRIAQHKGKMLPGFTATHGLDKLVYYEVFGDVTEAIRREKRLKRWNRAWKIEAIEGKNPYWKDLYLELF
jgi:putative endonuclease